MWEVSFSATAVCNAQVQNIQFRNRSEQGRVIDGAMIARGTDPGGNFRLDSILVGPELIPSVSGALISVTIPPKTNYAFQVSYLPKEVGPEHSAILDIAYSEPAGVTQVTLFGSSPRVGRRYMFGVFARLHDGGDTHRRWPPSMSATS
jgi:hypothetical protein